jgi:hypothetical protein
MRRGSGCFPPHYCLATRWIVISIAAMNFPPFWARGEAGNFFSWRWSSKSLEEAQAFANESAKQLAERFRLGNFPPGHQGYYPNRPFREQVLQEVKNDGGEVIALVTRNSYGCKVLNTGRVMFVDVDLPEPKAQGGFLKRLFGKPEVTRPSDSMQNAVVAKAETWMRNHDGWGWRIYRTRAGLRLLATHLLFDPEAVASNEVFQAMGADPLYTQLCKSQKCFRARLTPKPWRCGIGEKPERWPWLTLKSEKEFQRWNGKYELASREWATCRLIGAIGNREVHPDIQLIVDLHDGATRTGANLDLA